MEKSSFLDESIMLFSLVSPVFVFLLFLLSDQAMCLSFNNKPALYDRFSGLGCTFQGTKHGCKDFATPQAHILKITFLPSKSYF